MQILNRTAITIIPKQPFVDWINRLEPTCPLKVNMHGETSTYLVNDNFDNAGNVIKKHYKAIFENELLAMWIDQDDWPNPLTFKPFNEWFSYEVSGFVYDTLKKDISKSPI